MWLSSELHLCELLHNQRSPLTHTTNSCHTLISFCPAAAMITLLSVTLSVVAYSTTTCRTYLNFNCHTSVYWDRVETKIEIISTDTVVLLRIHQVDQSVNLWILPWLFRLINSRSFVSGECLLTLELSWTAWRSAWTSTFPLRNLRRWKGSCLDNEKSKKQSKYDLLYKYESLPNLFPGKHLNWPRKLCPSLSRTISKWKDTSLVPKRKICENPESFEWV